MQEVIIIEKDLNFRMESVTDPFVVGDANRLIFCFWAVAPQSDGLWHECGWAIFQTDHCFLYKYGYPNDEAAILHPLSGFGFDGASISKVKNSLWIKELEQQNRKKWPQTDYTKYEHWIFPFKETTLEIIARNLEWMLMPKDTPFEEIQTIMINWINIK